MATVGVVVGPVHHPALVIPFVFAEELDGIPLPQRRHPGGQIDIVGYQYSLSRSQFQNKALMPAAGIVIGEHPCDHSLSLDLLAAVGAIEGGRCRYRRRKSSVTATFRNQIALF